MAIENALFTIATFTYPSDDFSLQFFPVTKSTLTVSIGWSGTQRKHKTLFNWKQDVNSSRVFYTSIDINS